ncbi:circumsporozoite protein-membrane associated protein [Aporhodopirellula aestuarii]|uniref:Circumsporozoite protein-membrane associated protein n=1 Tax=Aporhodopirellula aestuarii TaxID=2950107 RepID=A0ABT0UAJ1_9BACT|nr:circumsporozoite protein-membrane associated protein [Aporhodopirellula aestuarii]MCM2373832.1 circumsporozoite protein-membrane associated protein [Aporhodopirellula aestuarii]
MSPSVPQVTENRNPKIRNSDAAPHPAPGGSIESFVLERIASAQSALWRAELTRRVLTLVIAAMAVGLVWLVMDQWIWSPGVLGRSLIAIGLIGSTAAYAYFRLWPVVHLRIREDYAARALERDHPELGHSLSSYVSLRQQRATHPRGQLADRVVQSVGASVAAKLKHTDAPPSEATGLMSWWAATIALIAALAMYSIISPKNSIQSAARLVQPLSTLDAPRRVQITDVSPGDTESLAGRSLEISATVKHLRDDEPVYFRWASANNADAKATAVSTTASDTAVSQQIRLIANEANGPSDRFSASVPISHHAHGTRQYHILAGDASAGPFDVTIRDTPVVQVREVVYTPPAYTGKTKHTGHTGSIQGVDGTLVELSAVVNRPISRAIIEFNPRKVGQDLQATAGASEMTISTDGTTVAFAFPLRSRRGGAVELQDYRVRVWDDAGQTNADPIIYPIRVIEDLPPEITIVVPQQSAKDVPIDAEQLFEIHAADVDFGLAEVEIEIHRGIDLIARSSLWKEPGGKRGNQVIEYRFRPSRMIVVGRGGGIQASRGSGLNVGDEVEVVAIATDNRIDPNDPSIVPGVTRTPPVLLRITAASGDPASQAPAQDQPQGGRDASNQTGENQSGGGEQGQSGGGQSGKAQQGEGQQGEGQQGKGQQGKGQQGKGQQGEGQQGEGQQGEGQQGEGQQGERQQQNMPQDGGSAESGERDPQSGQNTGNQQPNNDQSTDAGGETSTDGESGSGKQGGKPRQGQRSDSSDAAREQPPQDDGEAFERIQEYLKDKQKGQSGNQDGTSQQAEPDGSPENDQTGSDSANGQNSSSPDNRQNGSQNQMANQENNGTPESQDDSINNEGETGQNQSAENGTADPNGNQTGSQKPEDQKGTEGNGAPKNDAGQDPATNEDDQTQKRDGENSQSPSGKSPRGDDPSSMNQRNESDNGSGEKGGGEQSDPGNGQKAESDPGQTDGDPGQSQDNDQTGENGSSNEQSAEGQEPGTSSESQDGGAQKGNPGQNDQGENGKGQADQDPSDDAQSTGDADTDGGKPDAGNSNRSDPRSKSNDGSDTNPQSKQNPGTDPQAGSEDEPFGDASTANSGSGEPGQSSPSNNDISDESSSESAQGGGSGRSGGGTGDDLPIENELPDPVDLEYTKAATDMVLDYLDETRADPDPELLDRLKWTEQDLKRFRQRWESIKPIDQGPRADTPPPNEIEEALRSLGMRPPESTQSNRRDQSDDIRGLRDSGNRRPAPADIRDAFEAFRRGLSRP